MTVYSLNKKKNKIIIDGMIDCCMKMSYVSDLVEKRFSWAMNNGYEHELKIFVFWKHLKKEIPNDTETLE